MGNTIIIALLAVLILLVAATLCVLLLRKNGTIQRGYATPKQKAHITQKRSIKGFAPEMLGGECEVSGTDEKFEICFFPAEIVFLVKNGKIEGFKRKGCEFFTMYREEVLE